MIVSSLFLLLCVIGYLFIRLMRKFIAAFFCVHTDGMSHCV
jgi:hypothetical protein